MVSHNPWSYVTLIMGLAHYFWGSTFRRAIRQRYTGIVISKTLFLILHQKFPPQSDSPHPGPALVIGSPPSLTPTSSWSTRERIFPFLINSPRRETIMRASTSQNQTSISKWLLLHPGRGTNRKSSTILRQSETAFLEKQISECPSEEWSTWHIRWLYMKQLSLNTPQPPN